MTDGIHIPREVADAEGIPEELDSNVVGSYHFPDPRTRRTAAWIYAFTAVLLLAVSADGVTLWVGALLAAVLAAVHLAAAWPLAVSEEDAFAAATPAVPFAIGHASAAVTFHGLRSRPRWHVIVYSAEDPPIRRGLVVLDGVTGERVGDLYVEDVPDF